MKPNPRLFLLAGFLALPLSGHPAQPADSAPRLPPGANPGQSRNYSVLERGAHHRVMAAVTWATNSLGRVTARTNCYTELAVGMNCLRDGKWVESSSQIEIVSGGAIARKGPHTVVFAADLSTPGAIDCTTPDGKRLRSNIVGLGYRDTSTGGSVLIAELKSSIGQLLPSGNQVRYPDAFTNLQASVLYTYTRAGLQQDIILREQPSSPSEFGLNPRTTRLEVLTEFLDPPPATISTAVIEPQRQVQTPTAGGADAALTDETVSFGAMQLRRGKAFMVGEESNSVARVAVGKTWVRTAGTMETERRSFLVEEVKYEAIQPQLEKLPARAVAPPQSDDTRQGALLRVAPHRLLPQPKMAARTTNTMLLASSDSLGRGFVLDYDLSGSLSNFTFRGDTTYYVVGAVLLSGLTQIEGGSVVKFPADDVSIEIAGDGAIQCLTAPYRPAVFTAVDDNTIGTTIPGGTGVPTNYYGGIALDLSAVSCPAVSHVRFSYLSNALAGTGITLRDAQIVHCHAGFAPRLSQPTLYNVLIYRVNTLVDAEEKGLAGDDLTAENVTVHYCTNLMADGSSMIRLTNCLFACVGGWQTMTMLTNSSVALASDSGIFQTVGAGSHYLATNSPYHNAGTTNIDPALLAELRQKTTYPPVVYSNVLITVDTTLPPQAQRDTGTPDLGYHYDPLDYFGSCCVSNATLTLTNGVALAYVGYSDLWLQNGGRLVSAGTPVHRNYVVYYTLVQEQTVNLAGPYGHALAMPFFLYHSDFSRNPSLALRFTTLVAPIEASWIVFSASAEWGISAFDMRDCEVYGAGATWSQCWPPEGSVITLQDNLVQYANVDLETDTHLIIHNNLFSGPNQWTCLFNLDTPAFCTDNAFDGGGVYLDGSISHNAYLNGAISLSDNLQPSDVVTNLTWVTGTLGNYYLSPDSPLIDTGSTDANLAGLYHHTTQTNQMPETNSVVDIGFHYVAVDTGGSPLDTDSDSVPDYLEDRNGNGAVDSGETDSQTASDMGLKVLITRPKNNSDLP